MMVEKKSWAPSPEMKELLNRSHITPMELLEAIRDCYFYLINDHILAESVFRHQFKEIGASLEDPTKRELLKIIPKLDVMVMSFRTRQSLRESKMFLNAFISHCRSEIPAQSIEIEQEPDIARARQIALDVAKEIGFSSVNCNKIVTTVSELTRNVTRYTPGGRISIGPLNNGGSGIEILVEDRGSGIYNMDSIMSGQYVSKSGLGKGLAGCKRLMDVFDINTGSDGTQIRAVKYSMVK